ncbi:MAG: glycosyltransferase family 2 protein [Candidatus Cloacimonetes bacterium]|nr:glycosyltransferase family 2 protein [Candidatus Cloacimonadota bacterium]
MKLSFVIPAYNEEESIVQLYNEIVNNRGEHQYEIIFIEDGSTDNTFSKMSELAGKDANVKVIRFRKNLGKAAALQSGFNYAEGDVIFTMDADLQDDPKEIPRFLEKLADGNDLVTGWKKKRHDPLSKRLPSKFFNYITSLSFGLKLHDYNCGYKAYRSEVIKELDIYGEMHRYIPALAHSRGFKVAELVVEHRSRKFGYSKYGWERYFRGFLDLLTVKLLTHYSRSPLYLFGNIGASISFLGFLIALYLSVLKLFYNQALSNRPLLFLAILLIMVGLQFFSLGLLSELIVNQNRKLNKEKNLSIKSTINLREQKDGK